MPPPRGSQGYDFTPVVTHYILLFTFVLAIVRLVAVSPVEIYMLNAVIRVGGMANSLHWAMRRDSEVYVTTALMFMRVYGTASYALLRSVGRAMIGTGWFGILCVSASVPFLYASETCSNRSLQAFVIIGVLHTLGTDAIEMHRFQVSHHVHKLCWVGVFDIEFKLLDLRVHRRRPCLRCYCGE